MLGIKKGVEMVSSLMTVGKKGSTLGDLVHMDIWEDQNGFLRVGLQARGSEWRYSAVVLHIYAQEAKGSKWPFRKSMEYRSIGAKQKRETRGLKQGRLPI